jgi:pyruvate/2-oxoglutarate dehydrogenase complex dihydrolipoamide dehydrogenase (E3) component
VGASATELSDRGQLFDAYRVEWTELDRGRAELETPGFAEVLTAKGGDRILGATVVGHDAGEQLAPLCVMMNNGLGLGALGRTLLPYPTRSEYLRRLGDAYGRTRLTPLVARLFRGWLGWLA